MARKERRLRAKLGLPLGLIERVSGKLASGAKAPRSLARFSAGVKTPAYLSPPPPGKTSDVGAKAPEVVVAPTARLKPRPFKTNGKPTSVGTQAAFKARGSSR